ncbi:hypothetical protein D3C77_410730 [compost metagenome]
MQWLLWQQVQQFVEAFKEQRMAFFWYLLGLGQSHQDGAQVLQQLQVILQVGGGHDAVLG